MEESWHAARLIPTSGISGADEQERRATSALLAVMGAVRQFGRNLTVRFGAPAGTIESFIEVPFKLGEQRLYPDGLIRVTRGARTWVALVEVKTGSNELGTAQVEAYLDVAREQGFDAVLTISNQIPAIPGMHPTPVDGRKLRKVQLAHLSWIEVLTYAVMEKVHRGVDDPEQAWILGELIRYLEHSRSGAMQFEDMGAEWVPVREAVAAGTLRTNDKAATEVAGRWDQLVRFQSLRLGRRLGIEVQPLLTRRELAEPATRSQKLVTSLVSDGVLEGGLEVPNLSAPICLAADLRGGKVAVSLEVEAPRQGRAATRVNWLLRQLGDAPTDLRIDAHAAHSRSSTSELLSTVSADPGALVADPKRDLRSFRLTMHASMGPKRGPGKSGLVGSVTDALDRFYERVVQNVKPWSAPPPRLREPEPPSKAEPGVPAALVSTAMSSQDRPETHEPGVALRPD